MINYKKFISDIHKDYADTFTLNEVAEILKDLESHDIDTPISSGKKLIISQIDIIGEKTNGEAVNFSLPFKSGVNILIADNLKGKSSIFKMIQLALTGNNKLKHDVKKWIEVINLSFQISDKKYSAVLNFKNSRMTGSLYGGDFSINKNRLPLFGATGFDDYEKKIQDFFFKQFSYYSLKWTQKDSRKGKNDLLVSNASWKTYFKSIYLESKDSSSLMYGSQSKKIFQILLGLELTSAINYLSIKKDLLEFEYSTSETDDLWTSFTNEDTALEIRKNEIINELRTLNSFEIKSGKLSGLYEEYNKIINKLDEINSLMRVQNEQINQKTKELQIIDAKIISYNNEYKRIEKECNKTEVSIINIMEYLEIGIFFSNLNIKHCPNCNQSVSGHSHTHGENSCSLCHESIPYTESEINKAIFEEKLADLKLTSHSMLIEQKNIKEIIAKIQNEKNRVLENLSVLEAQKLNPEKIAKLKINLNEIETRINKEKEMSIPENDKITGLIAEKAVLQYKQDELKKFQFERQTNKDKEIIKLIGSAIHKLNSIRYGRSENIINQLSNIMLKEIHHFGLTTITEVKITKDFDISFKQDGDYIKFEGIAEGEQLRAKIAFFLSLIRLDVLHNFGRHTRFLIIDSPNKEEGDSNYLNGFKNTLKDINKRYGNDLQILIGTAERELSNTVENERKFEKGVYVF